MATPNYTVNYDDPRFQKVESQKNNALSEIEKVYSGMIDQSDAYYQKQIDAAKDWEEKQSQIQQEKTDFAIEKIEWEKEQAQKDYLKEQSASYVDWQKQSNEYGANAEQMAEQGLAGSGYAESSQVSMYNTYQMRVATARESYQRAVVNYNLAIKDARLQNNAALAEIAYQALRQQLQLSLEGFQYKNTLLMDQVGKQMQIDEMYYGRWQDVLGQINTENALAEQVRQYNEKMAEEKRQYDASLAEQQRQHNESLAFQKEQFAWQKAQAAAKSSGGGGGSSGGSSKKSSGSSSSGIKKSSGSSSSSVSKSNSSSSGSNKTIDMNSVLALGYGPISEAKLANLVSTGQVEQYTSGDKIKFRKSASTNKAQLLYNMLK